MGGYVFIAASDPSDSPADEQVFEAAGSLARQRDAVFLYLTRNGVLTARAGTGERWLTPLLTSGVRVFADPAALAERGISGEDMVHGVRPIELDWLVERLGSGSYKG